MLCLGATSFAPGLKAPALPSPVSALILSMNDICEPHDGLVLPCENHVADLVDFAMNWDRKAPLLIHCWAGISRSTAAAFITLCALNPGIEEQRLAKALRAASATANPNRRLVQLADSVLERAGRMIDAVESMGPGEFAEEAPVFALPARHAA